jgi:cobalt-zinc-cadmium resistance protein CzcA
MSEALGKVPGLTGGFQYPVQMRFNELIAGAKQDVVCKIFGEDLDSLAKYAAEFHDVIRTVEGAKDIFVERVTGLPQVVIRFNKPAIAAYGLHIRDVNRAIRTSLAGESAGYIYENDRKFDLTVRLAETSRNDLDDIRGMLLTNASGMQIPLNQVAEINIEEGPNQVQREDAKRRITVGFNVRDRDIQSVVEEVQKRANSRIKLPAGYYVQYGGQFKNLNEAKGRLMIAVPLALLLILLILYFSFGSLKYGLIIYSAIPLSAIGGIVFLWIRDMPFSISAGVGFIALFGVAVLNGIVLINEFNRLKTESNMNIHDIVLKGASTRLRPVLMTAFVASLGFLPMALSTSSGAEVQRPLATVVIGGLISATILTLFVLPVLYVWLENRKARVPRSMVVALLLSLSFGVGFAQEKSVANTAKANSISIDSILKWADQQALVLKMADKKIASIAELQKKPVELPKTLVGGEYGNINSAFRDTRFFINQEFKLPIVYSRQKDYYASALSLQEKTKAWERKELQWGIRQLCYSILDQDRREKVLNEFLLQYQEWRRISKVQDSVGEISTSQLNSIELQLISFQNQLLLLKQDRHNTVEKLKTILRTSEAIELIDEMPKALQSAAGDMDLSSHPLLEVANATLEQQKQLTTSEKNALVPGLNLGYSNLSIVGWQSPDGISQKYYGAASRFGIYQFGMSLPLFNGNAKAKINASKQYEQYYGLEVESQKEKLNLQLRNTVDKLNVGYRSYLMLKNEAQKAARNITEIESKRFQSGEISFAERTIYISQALQTELSLLDAILAYQLTWAEYLYLSEK